MPQYETIATYDTFNGQNMKPVVEYENIVLFGVHTCDLAGIQCLNMVFSEHPKDTNYLTRKNKILVMGYECNSYCDEYALCRLVHNHLPNGGYDLFFTNLENGSFMALAFSWKYRNMTIQLGGNVISFALLFFASTLPSKVAHLIPALQNIFLLSVHVASAVIAYGAFTISFISAIYNVIQKDDRYAWLPPSKSLEDISYHAVIIGFPFMTLVIILGAIWADIAWGSYWSWDPKETASLVTWLIYAGYLYARVVGKWKGKKTTLIIIIGFIAVIFTFFGNYIFSGLHSYN